MNINKERNVIEATGMDRQMALQHSSNL